MVRFQSGAADPGYRNYPAAKHVEGKAAIWIRENNSSGGILFHNHPGGTCGFCNLQLNTLLPEDVTLMSSVKHRTHDWDVLHARQREVD
jgi:hypothetical protein